MRRKAILWVTIICFSVSSSGCVTNMRYKKDLFAYQISPMSSEKRINKIIGLNKLLDRRPLPQESQKLPPDNSMWRDLSDRVTSLFLTDFEKSSVFKEIHCLAQPTDDIVINGSIDRFFWEQWEKTFAGKIQGGEGYLGWLVVILPVLALPFLLGAPIKQEYCIINISLEVKDNKTGAIIAHIKESSKAVQGISLYGPSSELGQDVTEAFRNVANKLKKELTEKINGYFNSKIAGVAGEG